MSLGDEFGRKVGGALVKGAAAALRDLGREASRAVTERTERFARGLEAEAFERPTCCPGRFVENDHDVMFIHTHTCRGNK